MVHRRNLKYIVTFNAAWFSRRFAWYFIVSSKSCFKFIRTITRSMLCFQSRLCLHS